MTSELKPIDVWEDATNAVCQIMQESKMCNCPDGECLASTVEPSKETLAQWNTRAVPDVPELVRYGFGGTHMIEGFANGDYALYSQAAKIIAADRAEIEQAKKEINTLLVSYVREHFFDNKTFQPLDSLIGQISQLDNAITITRDFKERAETAEAKLAQINEQEPVAIVELRVLNGRRAKHIYPINLDNVEAGTTLYASPAPAEDLKAKCDRYEKTLQGIAELSATGMSFGDQVFAVTSSRAALNVEASHDKG